MKSISLKPKTDLTQSTLKAMVTSNPAKEGCKSFLKREDRTLENSQTDRSQMQVVKADQISKCEFKG